MKNEHQLLSTTPKISLKFSHHNSRFQTTISEIEYSACAPRPDKRTELQPSMDKMNEDKFGEQRRKENRERIAANSKEENLKLLRSSMEGMITSHKFLTEFQNSVIESQQKEIESLQEEVKRLKEEKGK